jgi:hypothetical protein
MQWGKLKGSTEDKAGLSKVAGFVGENERPFLVLYNSCTILTCILETEVHKFLSQ